MLRSERLKGGLTDFTFLVIISAFIIGAVAIATLVLETPAIKSAVDSLIGRTLNAKLFVKQVNEGTKINSLLLLDNGDGRYADIFGANRIKGFKGNPEYVTGMLDVLDLSLVLKDIETGRNMFLTGNVREVEGRFIDIALPGLKKGRLGIDVEL